MYFWLFGRNPQSARWRSSLADLRVIKQPRLPWWRWPCILAVLAATLALVCNKSVRAFLAMHGTVHSKTSLQENVLKRIRDVRPIGSMWMPSFLRPDRYITYSCWETMGPISRSRPMVLHALSRASFGGT